MNVLDIVGQDSKLADFFAQTNKVKNSLITGITDSTISVILLALLKQLQVPVILVAASENKAQQLYAELLAVMGDENLVYFPVDSTIATQAATSSPDELSQRIASLQFLQSGKAGVLVTTAQGLQYKLSTPATYFAKELKFDFTQSYDLAQVNDWLTSAGFTRESLVAGPGEYAIRGDILDIFPLNASAVRIEFFGDEVDTIKELDVATQRSGQELEEVVVYPALDRVYQPEDLQVAYQKITADLGQLDHPQAFLQAFEPSLEALSVNGVPEKHAVLVDYLLPKATSLLDYLVPSGLIFFDDFSQIKKQVEEVDQANAAFLKDEVTAGSLLAGQTMRMDFNEVIKRDSHHRLYGSVFKKSLANVRLGQMLDFPNRASEQFFSQMPLIKTELNSYAKSQLTVVLQANNAKRAEQMQSNFANFDLNIPIVDQQQLLPARPQIVVDSFTRGFTLPSVNLVYLTERELFNRQNHLKKQVKTLENAERLRSYADLKPGDYVVHVNHGIGRFEGIKTLDVDGQKRDYITITYQKGDQLFVPADQLKQVQKYVGSEAKRPHVNKLGGSEWEKTKRKVQSRVEDIADDLVQLYAKRESEQGFAFAKDDDLQRQFEDSFPYVETPDQLRSVKEIKADMEKAHPMDRLVVGDVGFGKTEVALRAAFKAINSDKQVAFLVPTTILAQQHYESMQDRFKSLPVTYAILSRFQSEKEAKQIISQLKSGELDMVVGTHRILSKDVEFKDLGLLIIDEEQRFGVKHKERLKQLKTNVDVLTLTATPIPRTLHMSMIGVRDLSVIETPPTNRYPVQTYVMEQMPSVIRQAVLREMERGGQVFYLHNRVSTIDDKVLELENLLPEAKIEYIHGRMDQNQIEDVLYRFINREFDVLVTTTIIETGIDMPNVNTLLIEDADHYGLSQLYQLRGRIGRSARLAYAYFLYQPNKVLTEVGEKRLEAIRDFTELGSGFKIAMRDLTIRGAGNLLGAQQHGFIDSVGYDLYSQMLADAIKAKQGKQVKPRTNASVELGLEAYIPDSYISDQQQKIEFYKKIKAIQDAEQAAQVGDELLDRFGEYPTSVENLLAAAQLKAEADLAQVGTISRQKDQIKLEFSSQATKHLQGPNIFKALEHVTYRARVNVNQAGKLVVLLMVDKSVNRVIFKELSGFLGQVAEII